jgi:hypothetical protein
MSGTWKLSNRRKLLFFKGKQNGLIRFVGLIRNPIGRWGDFGKGAFRVMDGAPPCDMSSHQDWVWQQDPRGSLWAKVPFCEGRGQSSIDPSSDWALTYSLSSKKPMNYRSQCRRSCEETWSCETFYQCSTRYNLVLSVIHSFAPGSRVSPGRGTLCINIDFFAVSQICEFVTSPIVQVRPIELVVKLRELRICEWDDHQSKNVMIPVSVIERTMQ